MTIDISKQIREICGLLDLPYELVAEFRILPHEVTAIVYKPNENGNPYWDRETDEAAVEGRYFKVRTS